MRANTTRLSSRERFARGLKYSTVGPVDLTRGAVGIGAQSVGSSAGWVRDRYRSSKLRRDVASTQAAIAQELAAAAVVVSALPQTIADARRPKRRRPRPLVLAAAGAAVLAVGAVTFSIVRRSTQPEPSPLPPSVDVTPRP
jgi:hypothetical protein